MLIVIVVLVGARACRSYRARGRACRAHSLSLSFPLSLIPSLSHSLSPPCSSGRPFRYECMCEFIYVFFWGAVPRAVNGCVGFFFFLARSRALWYV